MRIFLFILCMYFSFTVFSQKIDFRNDSLFVNNYFINGFTNKTTLDSLLNLKSKEKKSKGKWKPGTKDRMHYVKYIYKRAGIQFTKDDYEPEKISIGLKLYKNSGSFDYQNNEITGTFKGVLFIGENYINDKRKLAELQTLKDCSISYQESTMNDHTVIYNCKIIYKKRNIVVLFDYETNEMTNIFID